MPRQRQAADATIRLGRNTPSLLKTVGGKRKSSSPPRGASRSRDEAARRSPSTDAPPESSEDEAEPAPAPEQTPRPIKKYNDKLELMRDAERQVGESLNPEVKPSPPPEREQKPEQLASAGSPMSKRALEEEDESSFFFSQPSKKKKTTYGKSTNIHLSKRPQSSQPDPPPVPEEESRGSTFKIPKGADWLLDDEPTPSDGGGFKPPTTALDILEADANLGVSASRFKDRMALDIDISTDTVLKSELEDMQSKFRPPPSVNIDSSPAQTRKKGFIVPPTFTQMASNNSVPSSLSAPATASPVIFDDPETNCSSSSNLSSPRSTILTQEEQEDFDAEMAANTLAKCPMCRQPVKQILLEQWMAKKKTAVRYQRQFCKSHRKLDSEETWRQRGYPEIDWSSFDSRIKAHFPRLERVLQNKESSFYRNALASSIQAGADRTLRQTIMGSGGDKLSAGYYGPKGSQRMTTAVVNRFAKLLRRLSTTDPLLSKGGGISQFVQMVLVPELTVLLVKKDMGVDDDGARVIIAESEEMGADLNGEDEADAADIEYVMREAELAREQKETQRKMGL